LISAVALVELISTILKLWRKAAQDREKWFELTSEYMAFKFEVEILG